MVVVCCKYAADLGRGMRNEARALCIEMVIRWGGCGSIRVRVEKII